MPLLHKPKAPKPRHDERIWDNDMTLLTATMAFVLTGLFALLWEYF